MQQEVLEGFQLSPQQRRVWLLQQHSAAFVTQCAVLLDGEFDPAALREALRGVFGRHEILRTAFHRLPGIKVPVQVVSECDAPPLRHFDLGGAGGAQLAELLRSERGLPFDCGRGPLLRLALVGLGPGRSVLLVTAPSLCADARTLQLFVEDLGVSYAAALRGEELLDETVSYVQVAEWQNGLLADEDEPGRDFWLKQEHASAQPLPYQRKPAGASEFSPESFAVEVDAGVAAGLESLARRQGVSVSSCLLACWQTLLWRLTGDAEVTVGLVTDDRKYEELSGALGPFARTLPVRAKFERGFRLGELLAATEAAASEALGWGEYFDWGDAADESGVPAHLPALFEYHEWRPSSPAAGLTFSIEGHYACLDQFRLKLSCARAGAGLVAEIYYDLAYFHAGDVERLASQFSTLLASAARGAESLLEELEVVSDAERARLLNDFSRTAEARPNHACFHELFERQAELTPAAVALQFEELELTYAELNASANRLAHRLRGRGVGPESLVAIYLERSAEMIVALLGVLKAGGAYLPLDAGYPKERVAALLAQARAPHVLTTQHLKENLSGTGAELVCLDADADSLAAESDQNPRNLSSPENLAYVLFTSGSTGTPKGVAVEHGQLVNYLEGVRERLELPEGASYATVSTLAADLGNTAIFPSLATGGRLHVISQERVTDADAMEDYLGRHAVDCLKIVPSHLAALLSGRHPERVMPRARLILGGEASRSEWVEWLRALSPGCSIFNHYGPTETTVGVTTFDARGVEETATETLPIGRPLAGSQIYLLDAAHRLVPCGTPGELCVGGAGVARGYLGRPGATAEKFIPNPFAVEPGARLYLTGDLARFLPDGNIEFLGRIDHQVKVRGYRIELGEIEATLRTHESVRECVVTAREDVPGEKHLVAYVVGSRVAAPDPAKLREHVRGKLPDYMVPSAVVVLDSLPLNRNGKVDRQALPAPASSKDGSSTAYAAPEGWYEQVLAGLWEEVLHVESVGRESNFFELGGHSLLATQLVSRVREAFGAELPLRALFESPTVAGLARRVAEARGAGAATAPALMAGGARAEGAALSFAQQRLWFLHQLEPDNPFYNSRHVMKLTGRLDVEALERALDEVVRRHESLRTIFKDVGGTPLQFVAPHQTCALPLSDLSALDEAEREASVRRLDDEEAARPFDLVRGPLFRASLLKLSDEEHVAMFTTHHIISDFWSMGLLVGEVGTLYAAFTKGEGSPLAELPIQYADFAAWQREWLQGETLERELGYWRGQLAGAPPALELPADKARPSVPSFRVEVRRFRFSAEEAGALKALGRREGATVFMTLLTAFKAMLYFHTGQDDISVGTPVAGRNRAEVESLIGCFLNTLVLRTKLSGDPTFGELLRRVRDTTLDAYTHQDVPFEKLVQEIQTSRDLSRTPLFQALIIFHNETQTAAELPELQLTGLQVERKWSNFDITLSVTEGDDGLLLALEYNSDLFDDGTMSRMAERFRALIKGVVADPGRKLSELPSVSEADRLLLAGWNDTGAEHPLDATFQQLFEEQAARTPEAVAVVCAGDAVTYEELNRRANRRARLLAAEGVGPETLVGLLAARGLGLMTSVLAVFKAGGAYLPLDPHAPAARLRQILAQSVTPLVLVSRDESQFLGASLDDAPGGQRPRVLVIEELLARSHGEGDSRADEENLPSRGGPDSLAYVIYTSGSTGVPKGAMVEQRGMVNHLYAKIGDLSLEASDIVAQTASQCFDISVWQMLAALVVGGRVEVFPDAVAHDARRLLAEVDGAGVTILETVPSLLRAMLDDGAGAGARLSSLRWMIPTGEALPPELCRRWLAAFPHAPLVNAYGPTECSDDVSHYTVSEPPAADEHNVPVGRPVANMRLYVVDKWMRLAPVGVAGELCVGGVGVGRGYLGEPSRTADVFVPDPFGAEPGARLYRTGDLARWRADGNVEFLGRIDYQVKVRGFRIELGEVEAALSECLGVKESVVVVREDAPGDKRLVAYVVAAPGTSPSVGELHARLRERLPEYMMPSAFVWLEAMPLTANGKVDRKALPAPDTDRPELGRAYVAPRNPIEETLAAVIGQILNLERVGVEDNFFELGGHSLLATQFISRLRESFRVEVPLREIFERPTAAELAGTIVRLKAEQEELGKMELLEKLDALSEEEVEAMLGDFSDDDLEAAYQ